MESYLRGESANPNSGIQSQEETNVELSVEHDMEQKDETFLGDYLSCDPF